MPLISTLLNWTNFEFDLLDPVVLQGLIQLVQQVGFQKTKLVHPGRTGDVNQQERSFDGKRHGIVRDGRAHRFRPHVPQVLNPTTAIGPALIDNGRQYLTDGRKGFIGGALLLHGPSSSLIDSWAACDDSIECTTGIQADACGDQSPHETIAGDMRVSVSPLLSAQQATNNRGKWSVGHTALGFSLT
jgi:hypothetical protein